MQASTFIELADGVKLTLGRFYILCTTDGFEEYSVYRQAADGYENVADAIEAAGQIDPAADRGLMQYVGGEWVTAFEGSPSPFDASIVLADDLQKYWLDNDRSEFEATQARGYAE